MGEARRRKNSGLFQREVLESAVADVSHALRRLALAAGSHLGSDCYLHAELGRVLLADKGFDFSLRAGASAWRVGPQDGDVIAHTPAVKGHLPEGVQGFPYHAWLESGDWVVDFTSYQFARKAAELDAADGGSTTVAWCPPYLLLHRSEVQTYQTVARDPGPGCAFYEAVPMLAEHMAARFELDLDDVAAARMVMAHPQATVLGPNQLAAGMP